MDERILSFASEARQFCALVELDNESNSRVFAQKCLIALLRLYERAMHLPNAEEPCGYEFHDRIDMDSWNVIMKRVGTKWTQDYYWNVYELFELEKDVPVPGLGQISDDIADIWRDVKGGLHELDLGSDSSINAAVWQWQTMFERHLAQDASLAIMALSGICFGRYADANRPRVSPTGIS